MKVTTPDGRRIRVGRRFLPWRPRLREIDGSPSLDASGFDDLAGIVFFLVLLLLLILAPVVLAGAFLVVETVLVLLLLPLAMVLRIALRRPWTVQTVERHRVIGTESVRGWGAATARIVELANAYERGEEPFLTKPA